MDQKAQAYRRRIDPFRSAAPNPWLPYEPWALYFKGQKQSRLCTSVLNNAVAKKTLVKYWVKIGRFPAVASDIIDWDAVHRAILMSSSNTG